MSSPLSLRPKSDPSIYGYIHLLKKHVRQYFTDLNVFIFCFDRLAAINTDLLCILLLSTNCSLIATKSCIIHPNSKPTLLKLSTLKELQFEVLEFFCYPKTWSTRKAKALSRQRLLILIKNATKLYCILSYTRYYNLGMVYVNSKRFFITLKKE